MARRSNNNDGFTATHMMFAFITYSTAFTALLSQRGTFGVRLLTGFSMFFSYICMLVTMEFGGSDQATVNTVACIIVANIIYHRIKMQPGHSFAIGASLFAKWFKVRQPTGRCLESMVAFFVGWLIYDIDKGLANWLFLSGASQINAAMWIGLKERNIQMDIEDARWEARYRQGSYNETTL